MVPRSGLKASRTVDVSAHAQGSWASTVSQRIVWLGAGGFGGRERGSREVGNARGPDGRRPADLTSGRRYYPSTVI